MKNVFYYLFYRLYLLAKNTPTAFSYSFVAGVFYIALQAWLIVSMTNYYNIFIDRYFRLDFSYIWVPVLLITSIQIYFFVYRDNWRDYIKKFDALPKKTNLKYGIASWIFFILIIINLLYSYHLMFEIDWSKYSKS